MGKRLEVTKMKCPKCEVIELTMADRTGVEIDYCSGCQERQTRNDIYAVENVTRVIVCKGCNRILCA